MQPLLPIPRPALLLVATTLAGTLVGCGDDARPAGGGSALPPAVRAAGSEEASRGAGSRALPPVPLIDRARFALARITTGPLPRKGTFEIRNWHAINLDHAQRDLIAMPEQALEVLSSEDVWRRYAGPEAKDLNPLHAILDVLLEIDPKPADVVLRWGEAGVTSPYLQLRRRAAKLLAQLRDPAAGPLLLEELERDATDREAAPAAARGLASLGGPWRARMVETVHRVGPPDLWAGTASFLREPPTKGGPPLPADDLLAWWALLAETGGPRLADAGTARRTVAPWEWARLALRPTSLEGAAALGVIPTDLDASSVLPVAVVALTGKDVAAETRCLLATARHAPYEASVQRDLAANPPGAEGSDGVLHLVARHCRAAKMEEPSREQVFDTVDRFVAEVKRGTAREDGDAMKVIPLLAKHGEEGRARLVTLLREIRPPADHRALLESAYDALVADDAKRAVAEVSRLLASADAADQGLARHLIQRSRDPGHLPAVDRALAATRDPALVDEYRRLLWWIHAAVKGIEPDRLRAFATTYRGWIEAAPDDRAVLLVLGLLDLGDAGARAYAEGLRGSRRGIYVEGLLRATHTVPIEVAEALLAPIDARTPGPERQAAWAAAYRTAPADAAPALADAIDRVAPAARDEAADVLETVRHRAPNPDGP